MPNEQQEEYCGWCDQKGHLDMCPDNPKKTQQERHKRFDERFPDYSISSHYQDCECSKCNGCIDREEAKAFIDEEVSLAVANREKEIVELLEKNANEINYNDWEVGDIINLISKNK